MKHVFRLVCFLGTRNMALANGWVCNLEIMVRYLLLEINNTIIGN